MLLTIRPRCQKTQETELQHLPRGMLRSFDTLQMQVEKNKSLLKDECVSRLVSPIRISGKGVQDSFCCTFIYDLVFSFPDYNIIHPFLHEFEMNDNL